MAPTGSVEDCNTARPSKGVLVVVYLKRSIAMSFLLLPTASH